CAELPPPSTRRAHRRPPPRSPAVLPQATTDATRTTTASAPHPIAHPLATLELNARRRGPSSQGGQTSNFGGGSTQRRAAWRSALLACHCDAKAFLGGDEVVGFHRDDTHAPSQ